MTLVPAVVRRDCVIVEMLAVKVSTFKLIVLRGVVLTPARLQYQLWSVLLSSYPFGCIDT